jgi:putative methyltransferase (TIGR04325 family)
MKKDDLKEYIPLALVRLLKRSRLLNRGIFWEGDYSNWKDALSKSTGYDSNEIITKVKNSLLKVKNGEAAYERDSVLFEKIQYDWPVLSVLMWVAALHEGKLNVMDFGGSLGSLYFQNRGFLEHLKEVKWNVIEQHQFVKCGKEFFENESLKFYHDIPSCSRENAINLIMLSSVLPYVEDPYNLLNKLLDVNVRYFLIDKLPLIDSETDRITVQEIPSSIYNASYPAWFFSKKKFMDFIKSNFDVVAEFDREIITNLSSTFKGLVLSKK